MTNPIISAQEGSQPTGTEVDVPTIKVAQAQPAENALQAPPPVANDQTTIPQPEPVLESLPDPSQPILDPMAGGDMSQPLNLNVPTPTLSTPVPFESVRDDTPNVDEFGDALKEVGSSTDALKEVFRINALPDDFMLPTVFRGDPQQAQAQLDYLGQRARDVIRSNAEIEAQTKANLDAMMRADAAKPKTEGFMQWLLGSGNTYNDFNPAKGQWGDYGSGALGAAMYTLGLLGKPTATVFGLGVDATVTVGNLIDTVRAKGFNPFSAEWRNDFGKRMLLNAPDPVEAMRNRNPKTLSQWFEYLGSRSYTLAPSFTPGRDMSFSNWQSDRSGRNNPLGFLYGSQAQNEQYFKPFNGTDLASCLGKKGDSRKFCLERVEKERNMNLRATTALILDVIADPTQLLRRPARKLAQKTGEQLAAEASQAAAKREAARAVIIGLDPVAARSRTIKLPNNGGQLGKGSQGAAFVRPVEVIKKYRAYQRRLALPPVQEKPGAIDVDFSVVSGGGEVPGTPRSVRAVAQMVMDNPSVQLDDLAKRFKEVDGREFPRGSLNVELDQLNSELAKAKTPKGQEAARRRFMVRVDKLERKWNEANPVVAQNVEAPKSDMSRFDMSIYDDYLITGSAETPLKALPASGESGRVRYTFDPKSSPQLIVDRQGRFITATPDSIRQVYKDNFEQVKLWQRAALPSESMRTQRMARLVEDGRLELTPEIDEGIREFRRTSTQPVLPPAREGYTSYTVQPRTYVHDPDTQRAIEQYIESGTGRTKQRAYLESDYERIGQRREASVAVDLGEAKVVLPAVRLAKSSEDGLQDALRTFDGSLDLSDFRGGLARQLAGTRQSFDGVTLMNRGEVEEFAQRVEGSAPVTLPPSTPVPSNVIPARAFAPQASTWLKLLDGNKPDVVDVRALEDLVPRNISQLNRLVDYLPAPDGTRLLDRSYNTYDGLVSAVQRRLTGYPNQVIDHYLATISRLGQRLDGLDGDVVEVLLNRGTGDSLPSASFMMSKPSVEPNRLPYAEPNGIPTTKDINDALDQGLDPNRMVDNFVEPDLADPIVRANVLKNTPDEYRGISVRAQELTIRRVVMERELDDLVNQRAEIERTKDIISERLEEVLDEVETLPDIGAKVLPGTAMNEVPSLPPVQRLVEDSKRLNDDGLEQLLTGSEEKTRLDSSLVSRNRWEQAGQEGTPNSTMTAVYQQNGLFYPVYGVIDLQGSKVAPQYKDIAASVAKTNPAVRENYAIMVPRNKAELESLRVQAKYLDPPNLDPNPNLKVEGETIDVSLMPVARISSDLSGQVLPDVLEAAKATKGEMLQPLVLLETEFGKFKLMYGADWYETAKQAKQIDVETFEMVSAYAAKTPEEAAAIIDQFKHGGRVADEVKPFLGVTEDTFYHGTRVEGLDLSGVDPIEGAARGEFGTAIYLTKDPRQAEAHAMADVAPNLPVLESRVFGDGYVHEAGLKGRVGILQADDLAGTEVKGLAYQALEAVTDELNPAHRALLAALRAPFSDKSKLTVAGLYEHVTNTMDRLMRANPSYTGVDEMLVLDWQRTFNKALRDSGVNGIEKGTTLAILNPELLSTKYVKPYGNDLESPLSVAASRYNALTMALANNPSSKLLQVQQKEALATLLTRLDDRLETQLDELDESVIRQLSRMTEHDEKLRNIVEGERAERAQLIEQRLQEADAKLEAKPFNTKPCL